jgi:hypothetical protein
MMLTKCLHRGKGEKLKGIGVKNLLIFNYLSWRWDLNPRPADYESAALPLSYASFFVNLTLEIFKNKFFETIAQAFLKNFIRFLKLKLQNKPT